MRLFRFLQRNCQSPLAILTPYHNHRSAHTYAHKRARTWTPSTTYETAWTRPVVKLAALNETKLLSRQTSRVSHSHTQHSKHTPAEHLLTHTYNPQLLLYTSPTSIEPHSAVQPRLTRAAMLLRLPTCSTLSPCALAAVEVELKP